jgi:hypothetical protein
MCMGPMLQQAVRNDALAKSRGEPTRVFHNVQPNYSNPEVMAAVAKEDSAPPVLRDNISTGSSDLKISKRKNRTEKRNVTSGRRTSKAKRFSTRSK